MSWLKQSVRRQNEPHARNMMNFEGSEKKPIINLKLMAGMTDSFEPRDSTDKSCKTLKTVKSFLQLF